MALYFAMNDFESLFHFYLIVAIAVSIPLALSFEKKLKDRLPNTKPYKWGFYMGCMGVASAPIALLFLWAALENPSDPVMPFLFFLWAAGLTTTGYFIIKRQKWAWIIGTILQFNIVSWIVNGVYQKNRWAEFDAESSGVSPAVPTKTDDSVVTRSISPESLQPLPSSCIFLSHSGQQFGPISRAEVLRLWSSGEIPGNARFWHDGLPDWRLLADEIENFRKA